MSKDRASVEIASRQGLFDGAQERHSAIPEGIRSRDDQPESVASEKRLHAPGRHESDNCGVSALARKATAVSVFRKESLQIALDLESPPGKGPLGRVREPSRSE